MTTTPIIHRGWLVEPTASGAFLARDPWSGAILVERSGMAGRFADLEAAEQAIDRKLAGLYGMPVETARRARSALYS